MCPTSTDFYLKYEDKWLKFLDVPGDGDCLYHCLAKCSETPLDSPRDVRKILAKMMNNPSKPLMNFFIEYHKTGENPNPCIEIWKDKVLTDSEWGSNFESSLFGAIYGIDVRIITNEPSGLQCSDTRTFLEMYAVNTDQFMPKTAPVFYIYFHEHQKPQAATLEPNHFAVLSPILGEPPPGSITYTGPVEEDDNSCDNSCDNPFQFSRSSCEYSMFSTLLQEIRTFNKDDQLRNVSAENAQNHPKIKSNKSTDMKTRREWMNVIDEMEQSSNFAKEHVMPGNSDSWGFRFSSMEGNQLDAGRTQPAWEKQKQGKELNKESTESKFVTKDFLQAQSNHGETENNFANFSGFDCSESDKQDSLEANKKLPETAWNASWLHPASDSASPTLPTEKNSTFSSAPHVRCAEEDNLFPPPLLQCRSSCEYSSFSSLLSEVSYFNKDEQLHKVCDGDKNMAVGTRLHHPYKCGRKNGKKATTDIKVRKGWMDVMDEMKQSPVSPKAAVKHEGSDEIHQSFGYSSLEDESLDMEETLRYERRKRREMKGNRNKNKAKTKAVRESKQEQIELPQDMTKETYILRQSGDPFLQLYQQNTGIQSLQGGESKSVPMIATSVQLEGTGNGGNQPTKYNLILHPNQMMPSNSSNEQVLFAILTPVDGRNQFANLGECHEKALQPDEESPVSPIQHSEKMKAISDTKELEDLHVEHHVATGKKTCVVDHNQDAAPPEDESDLGSVHHSFEYSSLDDECLDAEATSEPTQRRQRRQSKGNSILQEAQAASLIPAFEKPSRRRSSLCSPKKKIEVVPSPSFLSPDSQNSEFEQLENEPAESQETEEFMFPPTIEPCPEDATKSAEGVEVEKQPPLICGNEIQYGTAPSIMDVSLSCFFESQQVLDTENGAGQISLSTSQVPPPSQQSCDEVTEATSKDDKKCAPKRAKSFDLGHLLETPANPPGTNGEGWTIQRAQSADLEHPMELRKMQDSACAKDDEPLLGSEERLLCEVENSTNSDELVISDSEPTQVANNKSKKKKEKRNSKRMQRIEMQIDGTGIMSADIVSKEDKDIPAPELPPGKKQSKSSDRKSRSPRRGSSREIKRGRSKSNTKSTLKKKSSKSSARTKSRSPHPRRRPSRNGVDKDVTKFDAVDTEPVPPSSRKQSKSSDRTKSRSPRRGSSSGELGKEKSNRAKSRSPKRGSSARELGKSKFDAVEKDKASASGKRSKSSDRTKSRSPRRRSSNDLEKLSDKVKSRSKARSPRRSSAPTLDVEKAIEKAKRSLEKTGSSSKMKDTSSKSGKSSKSDKSKESKRRAVEKELRRSIRKASRADSKCKAEKKQHEDVPETKTVDTAISTSSEQEESDPEDVPERKLERVTKMINDRRLRHTPQDVSAVS